MEIRLLKDITMGRHSFKAGNEIIVADWKGKEMIEDGAAEESSGISAQNFVKQVAASESAQAVLSELPDDANGRIEAIETISNSKALEMLIKYDKRKTVIEAAQARLSELFPV